MNRILIANRSEIARRIARTCREMGISVVAVYTDADRNALHAREAEMAVRVPSYLDAHAIIEAALRTDADGIHPGYGFLAENPEFAEASHKAGLEFIGPPAAVIRLAGSKIRAREVVIAAGVQVVPEIDPKDPQFPLLIKASAGGGGRGLRIVRHADQLEAAMESARREAESAFGDGTLLLERYIEGSRHIEVQIAADQHGNIQHLGERECSIQRRHQKIIEESPSPALGDHQRRRICQTAVAIGRAMSYQNLGTVEFLFAPNGEWYFIEVNARIQVEHPVTELLTGIDLVRCQIEIAEGLPFTLQPEATGHAIEARLCAEEPANDFQPSAGKIHDWKLPNVRVDHAIEAGSEISPLYDSLLAKIVVHGNSREAAARKMASSLRELQIAGVATNRDFLIRTFEHPAFLAGEADTGFIAKHHSELVRPPDDEAIFCAATVSVFYLRSKWQWKGIRADYRNNAYRDPSRTVEIAGRQMVVSWNRDGVICGDRQAQVIAYSPTDLVIGGIRRQYHVAEAGEFVYVNSLPVRILPRFPDNVAAEHPDIAQASMPGRVVKILVAVGQEVQARDPLLLLEAMKIEHTCRAHRQGVVQEVYVSEGEMVAPGRNLVRIEVKIPSCPQ